MGAGTVIPEDTVSFVSKAAPTLTVNTVFP